MGLLDFLSADQRRKNTAALSELADNVEYYIPPELRGLLRFGAEMTPSASLQRAGDATTRAFAPNRTVSQRVGDVGAALSETAGVAAPMALAGKAGMPVAQAVQEGLMGFSSGARSAGNTVVDRMNQRGPVPTLYSNPLPEVANPNIQDLLAEARSRMTQRNSTASLLAADDSPVRMAAAGGRSALVSPSSDKPGQWRVTTFGSDGLPSGHIDTSDKQSAIMRALEDGYSAPMTPAQEVAGLLSSGRANEVTDDMLARFTPNDERELFGLYQSGKTGADMPMDEASRMARAEGMGFAPDIDLFHGTTAPEFASFEPSNLGKLGPGVYLSPNSNLANVFAAAAPMDVKMGAEAFNRSRLFPVIATDMPTTSEARSIASAARREAGLSTDAGRIAFQDALGGFDGVKVEDERTILDPSNIRSRFARFDPRLSHLKNLSAGLGGMGVLGFMQNQGGAENR